jgi:hypothetical protein
VVTQGKFTQGVEETGGEPGGVIVPTTLVKSVKPAAETGAAEPQSADDTSSKAESQTCSWTGHC